MRSPLAVVRRGGCLAWLGSRRNCNDRGLEASVLDGVVTRKRDYDVGGVDKGPGVATLREHSRRNGYGIHRHVSSGQVGVIFNLDGRVCRTPAENSLQPPGCCILATVDLDEKMLFITMLLVNSYCLGTRRQQWMPFRPPFATVGELFMKNMISCRIKLISLLFYRFI